MGRIDIQPLYKTRLPSKYVVVVTILVRNPPAPRPAISFVAIIHSFSPDLFLRFADCVVGIVISNQVPKSKLLNVSVLWRAKVWHCPWEGTIFQD
jgi:hypothetical protein